MKYSSLKNILEKSLVCTIALTSLSTIQAEKTINKAKTIATIAVAKNAGLLDKQQPEKQEKSELEEAYEILVEFKSYLTAFFDKNNKQKYTQHLNNFALVVDKVRDFANKIEQKYNKTRTTKDRQLLAIITEVEENVIDIYNVLKAKYRSVLTLAMALGKIIKKYTAPAKVAELQNRLNDLRRQLNSEEKEILEKFISTLDTIDENVPKSKISCLSRLNKVWKNK